MTTSSANNSVFRGFFEKQKLTGPNFIDWYRQLRIVLSIEDKLNYLEQPLPLAPVALTGQQVAPEILAAHTAWIKGSKEIVGLMLMTIEPEIQQNLEKIHANDMLKELKTLFAQQAEQELLQTTRDFHSCKQEEGHLILRGLRKEFDGFVQNYNMHSLGKTINELHAMLKLHEQTLPKNNAPALHAIRAGKVQKVNKHKKPQPQMAARGQNQGKGKNKLAYAPKPKIPPPPKREDPVKDSICHECGIFAIELNTFLNRSWIYDTVVSQTTLPKSFWDYALETAARILNMVPTKKVKKTPYEVWHGQAHKLSYLKVWGCEALVKRDTLTKLDKLKLRSIKCIFIGHPKETVTPISVQ
ncbi:hypothetical protein Tco_1387159 [Tanacetum coccineum]